VAAGRGIHWLAAFTLIAASLLVPGCGGGGQTFTGSEFIDRISVQGLSIELGRRLHSGGDAKELYAVRLPPLRGERGHGASGTLYVFGDNGGADDQLAACHGSSGLLCFRAANVVVVLGDEGSGLEAQRLAVAMKRLASQ
jgi:hypothetical protein